LVGVIIDVYPKKNENKEKKTVISRCLRTIMNRGNFELANYNSRRLLLMIFMKIEETTFCSFF
jgi:hypothetical protein